MTGTKDFTGTRNECLAYIETEAAVRSAAEAVDENREQQTAALAWLRDAGLEVPAADGRQRLPAPDAIPGQQEPGSASGALLSALEVAPPELDVPALGPAAPFADDTDLRAAVARLHAAYGQWSQLPGVQRYLDDDRERRGDTPAAAMNPVGELHEAYVRAQGALEADNDISSPELVLGRLYAVAAWSRALAPAVDAEMTSAVGELSAAAYELAARSQASITEFAQEMEQTSAAQGTARGAESTTQLLAVASGPSNSAAEENAPPAVVADEFSILYAAYKDLVAATAGTGEATRYKLGRGGVLADADTVRQLMDSGLLEHAEETSAVITPAGRYRLASLTEAGRDEPAVGDRVLLVSTGLVGIVGGYEVNGQGRRQAEVVFDREGWPDGWDLTVGPLYLTTLEAGAMDAQEAAERYRRAALRQFAGTLTDPTLRDEARAALISAALASHEVARAAREGHPDGFVPAVASWMSQWATQKWADVPEDEQPAWVPVFFQASNDMVDDRNGLYADVAEAIRSDLRRRPRGDLAVESRRLAPSWVEHTIEGQTYRAALLPSELTRGRLTTLSTVIVDDTNELVGRSFGLPGDGQMRWVHTNPGVPSPSVMGWLRLGGEVMWPPYSAEERAHMQAGPAAEQMSFTLDAGPRDEEQDEGLVDTTETGDADDPEYEVAVPGEDTQTTANPEPVAIADPAGAPEQADGQATDAAAGAEQQGAEPAATDGPASDTPAPDPVRGPMLTLGLREGPEGQIVARVEAGDGVHALVLPGISTADVPGLALPVTVETPMLTRSAQLAEQLVSDNETEAWLGENLPTGPLAAAWSSDRVRAVLIVVVRDTLRDGMAPSVEDVATWLVSVAAEDEVLLRAAHAAGPEGFGTAFAAAADSLIADGGSEHLLWTYLGGDGTRRSEVLTLATPEAYAQLLALPAPRRCTGGSASCPDSTTTRRSGGLRDGHTRPTRRGRRAHRQRHPGSAGATRSRACTRSLTSRAAGRRRLRLRRPARAAAPHHLLRLAQLRRAPGVLVGLGRDGRRRGGAAARRPSHRHPPPDGRRVVRPHAARYAGPDAPGHPPGDRRRARGRDVRRLHRRPARRTCGRRPPEATSRPAPSGCAVNCVRSRPCTHPPSRLPRSTAPTATRRIPTTSSSQPGSPTSPMQRAAGRG
ncbi:hypothetical protein GCM10020254_87780 [Streptomyces goshikiensis]